LIGGLTRSTVPAYACCDYWAFDRAAGENADSDKHRSRDERAGDLAEELLEAGFTALKVRTFGAARSWRSGVMVSADGVARSVRSLELIRERVGESIDIAVDCGRGFSLTAALRVARSVEPYDLLWLEDPMEVDSASDLGVLARSTTVPLCLSEMVSSRFAFRDLLDAGACGYVMIDIGWCGGLTEALKIAHLASSYHIPITTHDTGPVNLACGVHLGASQPHYSLQELVRDTFTELYPSLVEGLPTLEEGSLQPSSAPGHGVRLRPGARERPDARTQVSSHG
jgi:L-alanine-DL-glutamate epimerase-like enolase superfamily enzyme